MNRTEDLVCMYDIDEISIGKLVAEINFLRVLNGYLALLSYAEVLHPRVHSPQQCASKILLWPFPK